MIDESAGVFFVAIVLAHEITHVINLTRLIDDPHASQKNTPQLLIFRSYSGSRKIDSGNFIERLMLDGELHLSKPPPTPPRLFLVISRAGTQVSIPEDVVTMCVRNVTTKPIIQFLNTWQLTPKSSTAESSQPKQSWCEFKPLLTFPNPPEEIDEATETSLPTLPLLQSMHAR